MALCSSDRERRLWAWTLDVVVAIYSTIDVARALLDSGMLRATLVFGALLVGVTILTLGLKTRSRASLRRPGGVRPRMAKYDICWSGTD